VVASDVHGVLRVARLEIELGRRLRNLLEHELGIELDDRALDDLPGLAELRERVGEEELDPELADDAFPAALRDSLRRESRRAACR
jgi:hypothetical protein